MSWSLMAAVMSTLNGAYNLFKALFGKKETVSVEDANTQAVATENKIGKVTADISRDTQTRIDNATEVANANAADRRSQLNAAHGLRARAAVLDATRDSADSSTGSNG